MLFFPLLAAVFDTEKDAAIAQRLKQREPQALADLYDRYGRPAYSLVLRIVRNAAIAEDLVQETFLRVWNRAHLIDEQHNTLGPWVLTIARNQAVDYLRSTDGRFAQGARQFEQIDHPHLFCNLEREILNTDAARRLQAAFTKLSPAQQELIDLAYYGGLSQSEMAERLQQPLGTIKTRVRAALKILREELGEAVTV